MRWEAQLHIPEGTPVPFAKTQHGEWLAEIETRIAALRAQKNGEGRPLTRLNAIALAGRWYVWFVKQYEANPGPAKYWREFGDHLVWNVIYPEAPDSYHEAPKADPEWEWAKEPDVRETVKPQVAELARVATFLTNEGMVLNAAAYACRFIKAEAGRWWCPPNQVWAAGAATLICIKGVTETTSITATSRERCGGVFAPSISGDHHAILPA